MINDTAATKKMQEIDSLKSNDTDHPERTSQNTKSEGFVDKEKEKENKLAKNLNKLRVKKLDSLKVTKYAKNHVSPNTHERMCKCGNIVTFLLDETKEKVKVEKAEVCTGRFCPICQATKAKKDVLKISAVMDAIEELEGKAFIFVTLTAPNVPGEDLAKEINKYNKAFRYLMQDVPAVAKINKGYLRKLEVTYNKDRDDYHPHFHVVMAVESYYFKSRDYMRREKWLELWKSAMKDKRITQVDVKKAYRSDSGTGAFEISKYVAKSCDYGSSQNVFDVFYTALKGRQMLVANGLFKQYFKKHKEGALAKYDAKDETYYKYLAVYHWIFKKNHYEQVIFEERERETGVHTE